MADQPALHEFSRWVEACNGNEKQEARTFAEKLLKAWGWADSTDAGATFEEPIPKGGAGGGVGYADALVRGKWLLEMKSRGAALASHYSQLQRYWFNLTPKPTYAVLCNFDEFWVYDFNQQVDEPVDRVLTADLASRWPALAFLSKAPATPLFGNNQVAITEKQAKVMGGLFFELREDAARAGQFSELETQRFVLQCVLCMFAEDRGMLPDRQFSLALDACKTKGESTYDVLGNLFTEMNTRGITPGGRFKGTPYFNGGLFDHIPRIELSSGQLEVLVESANEDWRSVRPSIFGNIFEASSDPVRRHSHGQHFTSEPDILNVVRPTILEPWEERIEAAKTIAEYETLLQALQRYRVLDPACGSGNFLYMAYNGLKDLEAEILKRIQARRQSKALQVQPAFGFLTINQFYGLDTDAFAVELARVTLMIARKVAHDRLGLTEQELPLDNLDKNIVQADALFTDWPEADAIIGNPPFLGGKRIRAELGDEYTERIYHGSPETHNFADLCCYWFRKAHEKVTTGARAGLVGTNMIRRGYNRKASLKYITRNGGRIHSAVSSQVWSGDAKVHVSIVNWSTENPGQASLDGKAVDEINSFLKSSTNTSDAIKLLANSERSFIGVQPTGKGFEVARDTAAEWIKHESRNADVLRKYVIARDLTKNPLGMESCWIIDFNELALEETEKYTLPFQKVIRDVKPQRDKVRRDHVRKYWWKLQERRQGMRKAIARDGGLFVFPYTSKWYVPLAADIDTLPSNTVTVISGNDFYLLGRLWKTPPPCARMVV